MNIKILKTGELINYINKKSIKINGKDFNVPMYEGFTYFSPIDMEDNDNVIFIVCEENENIIGVLKLGLTSRNNKPIRYVSYVDVHKDYRRRYVATNLYKVINNIELESNTIINSSLTKLGKKAKLNIIFKREITKYKTQTM